MEIGDRIKREHRKKNIDVVDHRDGKKGKFLRGTAG